MPWIPGHRHHKSLSIKQRANTSIARVFQRWQIERPALCESEFKPPIKTNARNYFQKEEVYGTPSWAMRVLMLQNFTGLGRSKNQSLNQSTQPVVGNDQTLSKSSSSCVQPIHCVWATKMTTSKQIHQPMTQMFFEYEQKIVLWRSVENIQQTQCV